MENHQNDFFIKNLKKAYFYVNMLFYWSDEIDWTDSVVLIIYYKCTVSTFTVVKYLFFIK